MYAFSIIDMIEYELQQIGLTNIEAKIYIALLKIGSTTTGPIIKKTGLHRATVYDGLKRLIEKGLVTYIIKENTKYFQAVNPEHFIDLINEEKKRLEEKRLYIKNLIKKLNNIQRFSKSESAVIFQGKKGLKTVFEDILKCKELRTFASKGKFGEVLGNYFDQFQKKKRKLKIKDRILIDENLRNSEYVKKIYGNVRFLPEEYEYPIAIMVYADKIAFFVFTEYPTAFVIKSKEVSNSFKSYFELLWKIAKK